jgi:hypothetical protein
VSEAVASLPVIVKAFGQDVDAKDGSWSAFAHGAGDRETSGIRHIEGLGALDILLQGYLAITDKRAYFDQGTPEATEEFLARAGILTDAQEALAKEAIARDRLFRVRESDGPYGGDKGGYQQAKEDGYFWFDPLCPDVDNPLSVVGADTWIKRIANLERVAALVRNKYLGLNPAVPDDLATVFRLAHDEYVQTVRLRELEGRRLSLNHNRVKNEFINSLANADPSLPDDRRGENILAAWDSIRDQHSGTEDDVLPARCSSARAGLEAWPGIDGEIRAFFEHAVGEAGLRLTGTGEARKERLVGDGGVLEDVGCFVQDFSLIACEDEISRRDRLRRFLVSIDELHTALSEMRDEEGEDALFGGYLERSSTR